MNKIRIGIVGYGNIGRGVELAIERNDDMELVAVVTRRNPEDVKVLSENVKKVHLDDILSLKDEENMMILAKNAIKEKMSVRTLEKAVKEAGQPKVKKEKTRDTSYDYVTRIMEEKLQTKVSVDKNKITISYHGVNDLNRILEIIHCLEEE